MHERVSVNALCFMGEPLQELAGIWRALGARRVSLMSHLILGEGVAAAQAALGTGNYTLETITHTFLPTGQPIQNESGWPEARAKLGRLIQAAKTLGATSIYMVTGGIGSLTWEEAAECFKIAVAPCAAQAKDAGIPLLIETAMPVYADLHIAFTLRDVVTLAEIADVGVCMDLLSCWAEPNLRKTIERAMPRCHLIQVCDYVLGDRAMPGRAVPGDGAIPLERIFKWALNAGYSGPFDLELNGPRIEKEGRLAAVRRSAEHVSAILRSLGA